MTFISVVFPGGGLVILANIFLVYLDSILNAKVTEMIM